LSSFGLDLIVSEKTILPIRGRQCSNFYHPLPTDSAEEANFVYNSWPKIKEDTSIKDENFEIVENMSDELMAAGFGVDSPERVDRDAWAVFLAAQRHIRRR
jgi:hypothetical protein